MLEIGQYNELEIVKEVDFGLYLDGGPYGEILLPKSYTDDTMEVGKDVNVFLYSDSEDRLIATTQTPKITCGNFAVLYVKEVNNIGAFVDWGIDGKDLLIPFNEQRHRLNPDETIMVYAYLDEATNRIVGSTKLHKFFDNENENFEANQEVNLTIAYRTPLGYRAIINGTHIGQIYANEIFTELSVGAEKKGYIKQIREDRLIDVSLQRQGYRQQIPDAAKLIVQKMEANDGFLALNDKSSPEAIYAQLGMSKKAFKKAIGGLYRMKVIEMRADGIKLV